MRRAGQRHMRHTKHREPCHCPAAPSWTPNAGPPMCARPQRKRVPPACRGWRRRWPVTWTTSWSRPCEPSRLNGMPPHRRLPMTCAAIWKGRPSARGPIRGPIAAAASSAGTRWGWRWRRRRWWPSSPRPAWPNSSAAAPNTNVTWLPGSAKTPKRWSCSWVNNWARWMPRTARPTPASASTRHSGGLNSCFTTCPTCWCRCTRTCTA